VLALWITYRWSFWKFLKLRNRRTRNLHHGIWILPCITGEGRSGARGQDRNTKWNWKMPWNGNERGGKKTMVTRIWRQPSPIQNMIDQKHPENVEYFNSLDSLITNDARYTWEIKYTTAMAKTAFNKKKALTYRWSFWKFLKLRNRRTRNLHRGIWILPCVTC